MGTMTQSGAILAVCTGNLCRSPVLERLLQLAFQQHWPEAVDGIVVTSAGTHAMVGHPVPRPLMQRLSAAGADASPFSPRQLTREMLEQADLVIALSRAHRSFIVEMHPRAVHTTLTLRELARVAAALPTGDRAPIEPRARLQVFTTAVANSRGLTAPAVPEDDDVVDPYRGDDELYQLAWDQLVVGTSAIARALVPPRSRT
jgi:protein-tyrosine phosphatase